MSDKLEEFLKELGELSDKYKLYIGGCGCCGSPFIYTDDGDYVLNDIDFDDKTKSYKGC